MRSVVRSVTVTGVGVALMLAGGVAAQAQPPASASGNVSTVARTSGGTAVTSPAAIAEVEAYWTPERMAAAVDLDLKVPDSDPVGAPAPQGKPGSLAPAPPKRGLTA